MRRQLFGESAWFAAASVFVQLIMAATYAFAARSGTPETFGTVVALLAIAFGFSGIIDFGSGAHALRELASSAWTPETYSRWFLSRVAASFGGATMLTVWLLASNRTTSLGGLSAGLLVVALGASAAAMPVVRANLRVRALVVTQFTSRAAMLACAAMGFSAQELSPSWLFPLLTLSATLDVTGYISLWPRDYRRALLQSGTHASRLVNPWRGALRLGTASSLIAAQQFDTAVVGAAAGPFAAGTYGAVSRWLTPLAMLPTAFTQAASPRMARMRSLTEVTAVLRVGAPILLLGVVGSLVAFAAAPVLVPLILGDEYSDSISVMQILALAAIPPMIAQPVYVAMQSQHHDTAALIPLAIGVPVQLGLVAVLSSSWGANGAAFAVLVGQTASTIGLTLSYWYVHRGPRT